jgi:ATP-dependent helicase HrpB
MNPRSLQPLPIDPRLPEVVAALRARPNLVLVADPGAGKTTRVPRALLDAGFAGEGEIVVLEPRRLAARLAARRVAEELGERVGEVVGFQVRFEDVTSARTRVRFVTEGILTRRLASDPSLAGVAVVVLDEFHERHLHADVALALLCRLQARARPELRLVVMSATLDAEPVARFLGCEVLRVEGRRFEVALEYLPRPDTRPLEQQVASSVRRLVADPAEGDLLVFLPGASEIRRAREACEEIARATGRLLVPLHGDTPAAEQDRAVRPAPHPKVILSTNVAESSVTIEGVTAVVDSGLARRAGHSPWSGLPTLETVRVSRASATQRAGRAGRLGPGRCVRLYTQHDHDTRPAHDTPEIQRADLAEALLALRASGVRDPAAFPWFEPPPAAALEAAERLLSRLGAVSGAGDLTPHGRRMIELPLHPRLARLTLEAEARGAREGGSLLAALLGEREIRHAARTRVDGGPARIDDTGPSDLLARLDAFRAADARGLTAEAIRLQGLDPSAVRSVARARDQIARSLGRRGRPGPAASGAAEETALLVATLAAFPDRVARRREPRSREALLCGGGSVRLAEVSVVRDAELFVIVEAEETRGAAVARAVSAIEPGWLVDLFPEAVVERREVRLHEATGRVEETSALLYEDLVLEESRRPARPGPEVAEVLARAALAAGVEAFVDAGALARWRVRLELAAGLSPEIPPQDDAVLRARLVDLCQGRTSFAEIREASLLQALRDSLGPAALDRLERLAPERVKLPGGRNVRVEYESGRPPWIASRLQDFFGMREGPRVGGGRVPLVLHLLAPNQRAVQVTTDLAGFWERHYPAIRRELMRRYPKHAWPEDPKTASPPRSGRSAPR